MPSLILSTYFPIHCSLIGIVFGPGSVVIYITHYLSPLRAVGHSIPYGRLRTLLWSLTYYKAIRVYLYGLLTSVSEKIKCTNIVISCVLSGAGFPVDLCVCTTWSVTLREEHRLTELRWVMAVCILLDYYESTERHLKKEQASLKFNTC
jgi:hypothetical protein